MAMEIQVRGRCEACEGRGIVQAHAWEVYFGEEGVATRARAEQLRAELKHGEAIDLELAWFRERNWLIPPRGGYGEAFPPEEEPCPECEGAGHLIRWVPLDELPLAVEVKRLRLGLSSLDAAMLEEFSR